MTVAEFVVMRSETSTSIIEKTNDGVVVVRKKPGSYVDLEAAREDFEVHRQMSGEAKSPVMLVMNEMMNASSEAREFFSLPIHEEYRNAEAYVVTNLAIRLLVSFYMRTVKKAYPIRIFPAESEAMQWLRQFT